MQPAMPARGFEISWATPGDELTEEGEAVGGDEAQLHLAAGGDVLEPGDDVGHLPAAAHGEAPDVEEAAPGLHDLLERPARLEHVAQRGLGRPEAGRPQDRPEGSTDGAAAGEADRPLLAPPVPGHDVEAAVHDVEPDGQGVEHAGEAVGPAHGTGWHAGSIAGLRAAGCRFR